MTPQQTNINVFPETNIYVEGRIKCSDLKHNIQHIKLGQSYQGGNFVTFFWKKNWMDQKLKNSN